MFPARFRSYTNKKTNKLILFIDTDNGFHSLHGLRVLFVFSGMSLHNNTKPGEIIYPPIQNSE